MLIVPFDFTFADPKTVPFGVVILYVRPAFNAVSVARNVRTLAPFLPVKTAENFPANGKSRGLNPPGLLQ